MKNYIIIEGFGLPGSGKSTSVLNLKNHKSLPGPIEVLLRKEGDTKFLDIAFQHSNRKLSAFVQLVLTIYYLISRPILFFYVLKSLIVLRFNSDYFSVLRSLIEALYCYSKVKDTKEGEACLFIDEGLIQYLGALTVNVSRSDKIPQYIIYHVIKNYISGMVYFDVEFELAINRIKERNDGRSRFDFMADEEAIINLSRMREVFFRSIEIAQKLNIPVLKIDAGKTITENTESILEFLNQEIK